MNYPSSRERITVCNQREMKLYIEGAPIIAEKRFKVYLIADYLKRDSIPASCPVWTQSSTPAPSSVLT